MSIIGSYLAHIDEEVKARPAFLVDDVLNAPQERWTEGGELEQGGGRTVEAGSRPH